MIKAAFRKSRFVFMDGCRAKLRRARLCESMTFCAGDVADGLKWAKCVKGPVLSSAPEYRDPYYGHLGTMSVSWASGVGFGRPSVDFKPR